MRQTPWGDRDPWFDSVKWHLDRVRDKLPKRWRHGTWHYGLTCFLVDRGGWLKQHKLSLGYRQLAAELTGYVGSVVTKQRVETLLRALHDTGTVHMIARGGPASLRRDKQAAVSLWTWGAPARLDFELWRLLHWVPPTLKSASKREDEIMWVLLNYPTEFAEKTITSWRAAALPLAKENERWRSVVESVD